MARAIPVVILVLIVGYALRPGPFQSPFQAFDNPLWPGTELPSWYTLALGLIQIPFTVACLAGLVVRFRRSQGIERQQLKWFLFGVSMMVFFLVTATIAEIAIGYDAARELSGTGAAIALAAPAVTAAIGILRYRLFDIDVLIRRTLIYASVSAVLGLTYVAAVILMGAVLRPFTAGSDLAVAVSTLIIVALFQPLRRRMQAFVDRRFYRARYDAARTLDAFAARLRNKVELDAVRNDLLGAVSDTVRPAHASVWLRERP